MPIRGGFFQLLATARVSPRRRKTLTDALQLISDVGMTTTVVENATGLLAVNCHKPQSGKRTPETYSGKEISYADCEETPSRKEFAARLSVYGSSHLAAASPAPILHELRRAGRSSTVCKIMAQKLKRTLTSDLAIK